MSKKGNINYKYLRRRKNWFMRNLPLVIILAVVFLLATVGIVCAILYAMGMF